MIVKGNVHEMDLKATIGRRESSGLVTNVAENNDCWPEITEKVRKRERDIRHDFRICRGVIELLYAHSLF